MKKSLSDFQNAEYLAQGIELMGLLHEKNYRLASLDITSASLSYWASIGLIEGKENPTDKFFFSAYELFWLNIISVLSKFRFDKNSMLNVRKQLIEPISSKELSEMIEMVQNMKAKSEQARKIEKSISAKERKELNELKTAKRKVSSVSLLEILLAEYFVTRHDIFLCVLEDGELMYWNENLPEFYDETQLWTLRHKTHVRISFTQIAVEVILKDTLKADRSKIRMLSPNELEVLTELRNNNLTELNIRFDKDHNIDLIEATERIPEVSIESRYLEHILKRGYHEISFTTVEGKIVQFKRVTKKKVSSNAK